jgi:hypothetical protein
MFLRKSKVAKLLNKFPAYHASVCDFILSENPKEYKVLPFGALISCS